MKVENRTLSTRAKKKKNKGGNRRERTDLAPTRPSRPITGIRPKGITTPLKGARRITMKKGLEVVIVTTK